MTKETLVNKVAQSGLTTLDLEKLLDNTDWTYLDIKGFLVKEMLLMEKPFRAALKTFDWQPFHGKWVAIYCSADALIPYWAYMLLTAYLQEAGARVFYANGDKKRDEKLLLKRLIQDLNPEKYSNERVIVKGCGHLELDASFYVMITEKLTPHIKSLMYGEPCSTVPVYKRKK
ncbi:MAG: DUF2480 family protein [Chitinophagales bacterium]